MLKVGIIGGGAIAKMHIPAIQKIENAEIVGLVDVNPAMLKETAERYGLKKTYADAAEMFAQEKPDVVHILTPPFNHHALTKMALEAGAHVYVEKPLAMTAPEAADILKLAEEKGLKVCVGHCHLFDEITLKARKLVEDGAIGSLCGIESYYGFDMDPKYFSAAGAKHWAHTLPGGLLMNRIDHPLSVVVPFMGVPKQITAMAVDVKDAIPLNIPGELRIMVSDGKVLANVTVSLAAAPRMHSLTLFGTKGTLQLDYVNKRLMNYAHIPGLPKAISRLVINMKDGFGMIGATLNNVFKVLTGKFHAVEGLPVLVRKFYASIETGEACPVPPEQGLITHQIMDEAWKQTGCTSHEGAVDMSQFKVPPRKSETRVLVTGATGFVGHNLIKSLCDQGKHDVRVFVRNPIKASQVLKGYPVEFVFGDLSDSKAIEDAMEGVNIVYHLGAAMGGTWDDFVEGTVRATERVVEAVKAKGVKKLVYVSSIAVYGIPGGENVSVTENVPFAEENQTDYMRSKIEAERVIMRAVRKDNLNATILRPGVIYGAGGRGVSRIGYKAGNLFVIIGLNDIDLPVAYVGNVVQALQLAGESANGAGEVYNVVDDETVSQKGYIERLNTYSGTKHHYVYFPYALAAGMGALARSGSKFNGKIKKIANMLSPFHLGTCKSRVRYDNNKIKRDLGWKPVPGVEDHFKEMFSK
ncbi:MAG: NAD-dependent epimerase/dehydratase family protein [Candidatus Omnitrophota bacterium]|nr:NAD-dependent epimerase/dehydratase family protein [Candidatus Omnitrophota bacterium]